MEVMLRCPLLFIPFVEAVLLIPSEDALLPKPSEEVLLLAVLPDFKLEDDNNWVRNLCRLATAVGANGFTS